MEIVIPAILVVLALGLIFTLVGIIYRALKERVGSNEESVRTNRDRIKRVRNSLYGVDEESRDDGVVGEVEELDEEVARLNDDLEELKRERE